jgi:cytochrome P450 family 33
VQFQEWTREYGPIYTIWIAEDPVVIVTEYELMRELFIKDGDTFAGRHFMAELFKALTG